MKSLLETFYSTGTFQRPDVRTNRDKIAYNKSRRAGGDDYPYDKPRGKWGEPAAYSRDSKGGSSGKGTITPKNVSADDDRWNDDIEETKIDGYMTGTPVVGNIVKNPPRDGSKFGLDDDDGMNEAKLKDRPASLEDDMFFRYAHENVKPTIAQQKSSPYSSGGPNGIYAWLGWAWGGSGEGYGEDRKYVQILRLADDAKVLDLQNVSRDQIWELLGLIPGSKGEKIVRLWNKNKGSFRGNPAGAQFWYIVTKVWPDHYDAEDMAAFGGVGTADPELSTELLTKLGYDAVIDKEGIIYPSEPRQAIFLRDDAFEVVDVVENIQEATGVPFNVAKAGQGTGASGGRTMPGTGGSWSAGPSGGVWDDHIDLDDEDIEETTGGMAVRTNNMYRRRPPNVPGSNDDRPEQIRNMLSFSIPDDDDTRDDIEWKGVKKSTGKFGPVGHAMKYSRMQPGLTWKEGMQRVFEARSSQKGPKLDFRGIYERRIGRGDK